MEIIFVEIVALIQHSNFEGRLMEIHESERGVFMEKCHQIGKNFLDVIGCSLESVQINSEQGDLFRRILQFWKLLLAHE